MYNFLYNKTCTLIEKIIFWVQIVIAVILLIGLICLSFGTPEAVWIIFAVLWWVVKVFEGCYYFYKRSVVTLPEPEWLFSAEHEEIKDVTRRFRLTAIDAKRDNIFNIGLIKILFGVLMIVYLLI